MSEVSNGLENFEIEEETPELFNSGNEENTSENNRNQKKLIIWKKTI